MGQRWFDGYSADIEIYLLVGGVRFDVAQIGGGVLILREPADILPFTDAKLVIIVDGHEEVRPVLLASGVNSDQISVPYQSSACL